LLLTFSTGLFLLIVLQQRIEQTHQIRTMLDREGFLVQVDDPCQLIEGSPHLLVEAWVQRVLNQGLERESLTEFLDRVEITLRAERSVEIQLIVEVLQLLHVEWIAVLIAVLQEIGEHHRLYLPIPVKAIDHDLTLLIRAHLHQGMSSDGVILDQGPEHHILVGKDGLLIDLAT
jgi:hypothetical protein